MLKNRRMFLGSVFGLVVTPFSKLRTLFFPRKRTALELIRDGYNFMSAVYTPAGEPTGEYLYWKWVRKSGDGGLVDLQTAGPIRITWCTRAVELDHEEIEARWPKRS